MHPSPDSPEPAAKQPSEAGPLVRPPRRRSARRLPFHVRVWLWVAGILLLILGIAGLFLPFLQGVLFLILAAAVLSLASHRVYRWMQNLVAERWPNAWQRLERFRTRVRWKFRGPPEPKKRPPSDDPAP